MRFEGFPGGSVVKKPTNAGDTGDSSSITGSGRSPEGENGNPLRYFHLENAMDRGAWAEFEQRVFSKDSALLSKLRILTVALLTEGIVLPKSATIPLVEALCQLQVKVAQLCLTLCDPMDYTIHGILQAGILEWVHFSSVQLLSHVRLLATP